MRKLFIEIFTDAGEEYDYAKVSGTLVLVVFLALTTYYYIAKDSKFDPIEWATGATIIIGGAAGVSKVRDSSGVKKDNAQ